VGGHDCEPPTAPLPIGRGAGPLPRSTSDLGPVDKTPHGTGHVGSVARCIVVTPLGWSHVSPDVLARLDRKARGLD
jgi:hypothetical protein